jgi:hypothetical protein
MPATGTSMTHTMMAARIVATTVSARVRMRAAAAALSCGMLESVLLMSLQIEPRMAVYSVWLFCLAILSGRVTAVEAGDVSQCAMPE